MDEDTVELIKNKFGLSAGVRLSDPVERGFQGEVWRLTDGTDTYAVKRCLVALSAEQAMTAYDFQLRAAEAGVAAPRQHCCVDGSIMIDDPSGMIRLFDWVEMAPPERGLDPATVGTVLAQLHRSGGPIEAEIDPWYTDPVGEERWHWLLEEFARRDGPYAAEVESLLPTLIELEQWLIRPHPPYTLGHTDLWADNVRAWNGPGLLVIDWDNCGPVDPSQELGMVVAEYGTDRTRAATLQASYRAAGGPGRITRPQDFSTTIATLSHILELGLQQWLDAADETEQRRAAGRVQEWVETPLRPEQIRDLVDWCAL